MPFERGRAGRCEPHPGEPAGIRAFRRTLFPERNEARVNEGLQVLGRLGVVDLQCVADDCEVQLVDIAQLPPRCDDSCCEGYPIMLKIPERCTSLLLRHGSGMVIRPILIEVVCHDRILLSALREPQATWTTRDAPLCGFFFGWVSSWGTIVK
jgi:hypothetical protein